MIWECNILRYQKVQIIEFIYFQLYTENGSMANKYQLLDSMEVSCLLGYTSRWCMASVECCPPSVPPCDAGALHAPLCRYSRKSITIVSVQGAPSGASLPAIHPRWPPFGVTISKQFGFSCDSKPYTCLKGDGRDDKMIGCTTNQRTLSLPWWWSIGRFMVQWHCCRKWMQTLVESIRLTRKSCAALYH